MTPEDIDKLEAGDELDVLIAEKVMGCKTRKGPAQWLYCDCPKGYMEPWPHGNMGSDGSIKDYSSDIAAAWEVVEKYKGWGSGFHIWTVNLFTEVKFMNTEVRANTAPLAICRAALKAISAHKKLRNRQLTELFYNSLTRRGKAILTQQAIDDLEAQEHGNDD
jgi:Phage ABA sandwich domain